MISLDLGVRYSFPFKFRMIGSAIDRGMKIEICYGHGISSSESDARRNLIQNACSLVRSARGRGIVISSEASSALGCRAPHDIVNLAVIWGLKQEIAMEAVTESARVVVAAAQLRKRSYKGAIDVVRGGESNGADAGINIPKQKRKAEDITQDEPKQLSKAQTKKRQKKKASMAGNTSGKPEPKGEVASD
jgi:ribonuclease P/MRP protein subunit RPP1